MTTTDTDALTERIARVLAGASYVEGPHAEALFRDEAAAILPIVAEEVRKAKAEALREAAERARGELGWAGGGHTSTYSVRKWLRELAIEHETRRQR